MFKPNFKKYKYWVKPVVSFVGLNMVYCADATAFDLQATPTGGTFTINGTNATQFNASVLGAGNYVVKYNYVDPTDVGCANEIIQNVTINALPNVVFANVNDTYCVNETIIITPSVQITFASGEMQVKICLLFPQMWWELAHIL